MTGLRDTISKLIQDADLLDYQSFPKSEHGYPRDHYPDWIRWVKRVKNTLSEAFKAESSVIAVMRQGEGNSRAILGNGPNVFQTAKNELSAALKYALKPLTMISMAR